MNLIYTLTIILIFTLHMLIYKTEEKQNILKWLVISIISFLCYNIFICVTMSFLKISSILINLSIINIILGILLSLKIYKDKKIQKYYINKIDIIALIIIFIIVIITAIKLYGIPLNIYNKISDGAVHYFVADEFYNYSMLLLEKNSDMLNLWSVHFFMPGAYINTGILFKIFAGIINETYFCELFFCFDISIWLLSGLLMYSLLSRNKKEEKQKILPLIFSLVYMLGYPLNTLISGFSYLAVGLDIIIGILIIMQEEINKYYKMLLMFLLDFGIMFSYYFFAPVVYFAVFLQIILNIRKNKDKIFKKENILQIIYTLIIPGIFGILFFVVFQTIKLGNTPNYANIIAIPGDIYKNLCTNMIIFILLSIYYIIYCIKNKKDKISNKMLVMTIIFMLLLFIGMKLQKVSEYYYYKTYYLLWIFTIGVAFNGIEQIALKNKKIKVLTYLCIFIYCIGIIVSSILTKRLLIFDIYKENSEQIKIDEKIILHEELEILDYYNQKINTNRIDNRTYIFMTSNYGRDIWLYAITKNPYIYVDLTYIESTSIEQYILSDKKYCILFKNDFDGNYENIDEEITKNNLKVLFRNNVGMILEKYSLE